MVDGTEYSRLIQKHHAKAETEDNNNTDDLEGDGEAGSKFQRSLSTMSSRSNASTASQTSEDRVEGKEKQSAFNTCTGCRKKNIYTLFKMAAE